MRCLTASVLAMALIITGAATALDAAVMQFNFPITVDQEVPTPTFNPGQLIPAGVGFVTYDTTSMLMTWEIHYAGMTGPVTGAHVHGPAPMGVNNSVLWHVASSYPQPTSGTLTGTHTLTSQQEQWLLDGLLYVNLHTAQNPPGEIRGQIIPEPATLGAACLGGLLLLRRRRA